MAKRCVLLWDLDGTLTDPMLGITRSVQYALRQFGIEVSDLYSLCPFIGPPLKDSFKEFYGFSDDQADEAVRQYRVYFAQTGIFENAVYPGIPALLADLQQAGVVSALATSKPTVFAQRILEHFQLSPYFNVVVGSELDGRRSQKAEVIAYALQQLGSPSLSEVTMIGDRRYDVLGAQQNGIPTIGVAYGYGSREELLEAGAITVVDTVSELHELLLQ